MIDKESYPLNESNYYKEVYEKTQIVIGHNGRKDMRHFQGWLNRINGKYKKTSTYSIDKDGSIYQHYDPKYYSDFIDDEQDKSNISISLVNVGWLKLDEKDIYIDWLGHIYSKDTEVFKKNWRGYDFWESYTNNQLESLVFLINYLCETFNIEKEYISHNVYDEYVDIFKGITFRSNYNKDITDISPAFNINKIKNER